MLVVRSWGLPRWHSGKESACNAGYARDAVSILGQEDPLEKGMATYSNILPWKIPWTRNSSWEATVQGTLKSLLQHHSSKASILGHSAFFTVQLSHPYMTTGKTIALTRQAFVGKIMPLLFNMLSRLVIAFLPRSF